MDLTALPPLVASAFSSLAIAALLLTFVMLGSRWLNHYLYAFAAESWLIAGLSATVGLYAGYRELLLIAALTAVFRGLVLPYLLLRIIRGQAVDHEVEVVLRPATSLLVGAAVVLFALVVAYGVVGDLRPAGGVAVLALTLMLAMKLIGFLMLAVRQEAVSQVLGLLVLENGIFLGAQILVPGMPLLFEIVILFDLLVAVACFGILVRYLQTAIGSTSSAELRKLRG